jgi:D-lactate dehydrogenase
MKAIVYSTRKDEKDILASACKGRHELTWHTAPLCSETARNAAGHKAAIVFTNDTVSGPVIAKLAAQGVKYLLTRSAGTDHIDFQAAAIYMIKIKSVPNYSPYAVAEHAVALALAMSRHLVAANRHAREYDFSLAGLMGFNLNGKTVGIVGMGKIGKVTGRIFQGFGCNVIGCDTDPKSWDGEIKQVDLDELFTNSDIISLHIPLNQNTSHLINSKRINQMKNGVMLINTARGGLVNTVDALAALDTGKLGYYGADVYEFEKGIFFEDHEADRVRDALLSRLMEHSNVLLTPHQGFLTIEALEDIAEQTIQGLDEWELLSSVAS